MDLRLLTSKGLKPNYLLNQIIHALKGVATQSWLFKCSYPQNYNHLVAAIQ